MPSKNRRTRRRASDERPSTFRYTLRPGIHNKIVIKTAPGAVCTLHQIDEVDPARALKLYADDDGNVVFHVRPSAKLDRIAEVVIDADVKGEVTRYILQMRSSNSPTKTMPHPEFEAVRAKPRGATVRQALTRQQAARLSDKSLIKRGYPPRPHPEGAPGAYNAWLRAVTSEMVMIKPKLVSRPELRHNFAGIVHGPATSNNWSGFELRGGTYDWVTGTWNVPAVSGEANTYTYSSMWVGIDGDGTTDLVQAGTEQENLDIDIWFIHFSFSTYYAWTEFLPQQPTEQQVTNFPIHPGDQIFVEVFIANAGGSPNLSGFFGQFVIMNLTTSQSTWVYTPVGTTKVGGSEAVWIMERPTVNGSLPDLADYGSANMDNAYARKTNSARHQGYVPYQGATNLQISMLNGADTISTVTPISTYTMRFNWKAFH